MEKIITLVIVLLIAFPCYLGLRRIATQLLGKAKGCGCSSGSACSDHGTCDQQTSEPEPECHCEGTCHCHHDLACDKTKASAK